MSGIGCRARDYSIVDLVILCVVGPLRVDVINGHNFAATHSIVIGH